VEKYTGWKETTSNPKNMEIYNNEIRDFLPNEILDFHTHVMNKTTLPAGHPGVPVPGGFVNEYTVEELIDDMRLVFPDKKFSAVIMGTPEKDFDTTSNNKYIAGFSKREEVYPLRLVRPEENPEDVYNDIINNGYYGFKPYLNYVDTKSKNDIEIMDMMPPEIMEIANETGRILMLHIPRPSRLADPLNQEQILKYAAEYPNVKIVLAHVGRAFYMKSIINQLDRISTFPNIYFDISAVSHWEVLEYLFARFDRSRLMYGTDTPIGLMGLSSVELNNQYTYISSKPWPLSISDDHQKLKFTCFAYEMIRAVKKAVTRVGLNESFIEDLYFRNGKRLLDSLGVR
jgi:uncharacterized protein